MVQSLVGKLGSHRLWGQKNQNIKQKQYCNKFNKDLKKSPHPKKEKDIRLSSSPWWMKCLSVYFTVWRRKSPVIDRRLGSQGCSRKAPTSSHSGPGLGASPGDEIPQVMRFPRWWDSPGDEISPGDEVFQGMKNLGRDSLILLSLPSGWNLSSLSFSSC